MTQFVLNFQALDNNNENFIKCNKPINLVLKTVCFI